MTVPGRSKTPERLIADKRLHQRLQKSRWIQRGVLSVALAAGTYLGIDRGDTDAISVLATGVAPVTWAVGVGEHTVSRHACRKIVGEYAVAKGYASAADAAYSGETQTVLEIKDGDFKVKRIFDSKAFDPEAISASITSFIPPGAGWVGATFLARGLAGNTLNTVSTQAEVLGSAILTAAALACGLNEASISKVEKINMRRLDNIDGGLSVDVAN